MCNHKFKITENKNVRISNKNIDIEGNLSYILCKRLQQSEQVSYIEGKIK